jgi:hypothetical protein
LVPQREARPEAARQARIVPAVRLKVKEAETPWLLYVLRCPRAGIALPEDVCHSRDVNAPPRQFISCRPGSRHGLDLAAALWAAGSSKAEEKAQPRAFNSAVAFDVYAVIGEQDQLVGSTPSALALTIPPCRWWYVEPRRPVDMEKVRQEVEAQGIPGLKLWRATAADLEHLKGLTALQVLDLCDTQVTEAGLKRMEGLIRLRYLDMSLTGLTDAGLEHLKGLTALHSLVLRGTKATDAGVEQLKKSLPNVKVWR